MAWNTTLLQAKVVFSDCVCHRVLLMLWLLLCDWRGIHCFKPVQNHGSEAQHQTRLSFTVDHWRREPASRALAVATVSSGPTTKVFLETFNLWPIYTPGSSNIGGWKMDLLRMYFLSKIGIFHCYVSLPEGKSSFQCCCSFQKKHIQQSNIACKRESTSEVLRSKGKMQFGKREKNHKEGGGGWGHWTFEQWKILACLGDLLGMKSYPIICSF